MSARLRAPRALDHPPYVNGEFKELSLERGAVSALIRSSGAISQGSVLYVGDAAIARGWRIRTNF